MSFRLNAIGLLVAASFFSLMALAGPPTAFLPNVGQWEGPHSFEVHQGNARLFYLPGKVRIALYDAHELHEKFHHQQGSEASRAIQLHALDLEFPGSKAIVPQAEGPQLGTNFSFFRGQLQHSTQPHQQLRYAGLYNGIDLLWYASNEQLKYDFIVAPNANANEIKLRYVGGQGMQLVDGRLRIQTSVGHWYENAPYAYQLVRGRKQQVACRFKIKGDEVSFDFPQGYDRSKTLIIDPTLVFSTYSGAAADNFGFTAAPDIDGNFYLGGIVFGPAFPVTTGAYQTTFIGNSVDPGPALRVDIGLMKFDPTGSNLLYCSFLGGNRVEYPISLVASDNGEAYLLSTTSSTDFPTTSNAYQTTHGGGFDIAITRLSANGSSLLSGTFFGGSGDDGNNKPPGLRRTMFDQFRGDILITSNGDIAVASVTESSNLGTPGSFQPSYRGGQNDGLVFRLSDNLNQLRWASYVGGDSSDALYSVKEGLGGAIYVAGGSFGGTNLSLPAGGHQSTHAGSVDGIVLRLNGNNGALLSGSFLGSAGRDQIFFLDVDGIGDVYVNGHTDSNLVTFGTNYNDPRSGQYIGCFKPELDTLRWLGRYGTRSGAPEMNLSAFVVDLCQNIYVAGWTGTIDNGIIPGPTNLTLTNNAMQNTSDGFDFYLAAFSPGMLTMQYSTYFGGAISTEHTDGGTSRFDKRGVIYLAICAGCGGNSDLPVTPNAFADTNGSINCNMAAVKLAFELESGLGARFSWDDPGSYCAPLSLQFRDQSRLVPGPVSYLWISSKGDSSTQQNPIIQFPEPGVFAITLLIENPVACNRFDTLTQFITVNPPPAAALNLPPDTCVCDDAGFVLQAATQAVRYSWTGQQTANTPSITPTESGTYTLEIEDDNGCIAVDSVQLRLVDCLKDLPNVITPNGDGLNDAISLQNVNYLSFDMRVFNRWGQVVFVTNNANAGWGGQDQQGFLVEAGDYIMRIRAEVCPGQIIEKQFPMRVQR